MVVGPWRCIEETGGGSARGNGQIDVAGAYYSELVQQAIAEGLRKGSLGECGQARESDREVKKEDRRTREEENRFESDLISHHLRVWMEVIVETGRSRNNLRNEIRRRGKPLLDRKVRRRQRQRGMGPESG